MNTMNTMRLVGLVALLGLTLGTAGRLEAVPITLRIDFGPDNPRQRVQAGFSEFSISPDGPPNRGPGVARLFGAVQVTASASSGNPNVMQNMIDLIARDRGVPPAPMNAGRFTQSDLIRDFIASVNTADSLPVLTLVVDGLSTSTRYQATFWSYDAAAQNRQDQVSEWFMNNQQAAFARHTYNTSLPPTFDTDPRISFSTRFDVGPREADRRFVFTGKYVSGTQKNVVLNGVEFIPLQAVPVPEPSTLFLVSFAGVFVLAYAWRRRGGMATSSWRCRRKPESDLD